jgi:hypothetical protein
MTVDPHAVGLAVAIPALLVVDPMTDRRLATLRAALGFLELSPRAPELRLLHQWLDSWVGVGLITVGVERLGYLLSLSHIAEGEWRAQFSAHRMWSSPG